jgi:hypothetical protein
MTLDLSLKVFQKLNVGLFLYDNILIKTDVCVSMIFRGFFALDVA